MERLISLFREPDYEEWSPSQSKPPPQAEQEEPFYFQQLLEYLQKRKAGQANDVHDVHDAGQEEDAEMLIGCGI